LLNFLGFLIFFFFFFYLLDLSAVLLAFKDNGTHIYNTVKYNNTT
jgi:hypothetical protein